MKMKAASAFLGSVATMALLAVVAAADGDCCSRCGCREPCEKVCRLVCEQKKVEVVCWGAEREDFCVPCPSKAGCKRCETVCEPCETTKDDEHITSKARKFVWFEWFPKGAKTLTKTKLMKKVETKTVPSYRWVVEDLCADCRAKNSIPGDSKPPSQTK